MTAAVVAAIAVVVSELLKVVGMKTVVAVVRMAPVVVAVVKEDVVAAGIPVVVAVIACLSVDMTTVLYCE